MPRNQMIVARRDTAANWAATNPVLADGELGYDKTNRRYKTGDGVTAWNSLGFDGAAGQAKILGALAVDRSALAMPPLMDPALVPAVAFSAAGAGSAITNGVAVTVVDGPFTVEGGITNPNYQGAPGFLGPSGPPGPETTPMLLSFDTDASDFEITYLGSASPQHRLWVNGELRDAWYQSATGGSGQQHRMRVTWPASRKWRRYTLNSASMGINTVVIGPRDTILPPGITRPKLAIIGDSYIVNNSAELGMVCCRALGFSPLINGSGGTGYLNAASGGKQVFGDRVAAVMALGPDALVVFGGINDGTTGLGTAAAALVTAARAINPNLPVVLVGSQNPPLATSAATKSALLKSAAAASRAAYVDPVTGHVYNASGTQVSVGSAWITGTGYAGSPTTTGNGNVWIDTDGYHPSPGDAVTASGYQYHGLRLAAALRAALPTAL